MAEVIDLLSSDEEYVASNSNPEFPVPSTSNGVNFSSSPSPSTSSGRPFQNFLDTCKLYINDKRGLTILQRLENKGTTVEQRCQKDEQFLKLVLNLKSKVLSNPRKIFVFIKELHEEIKHCNGKQAVKVSSRHESELRTEADKTEATEDPKLTHHIKELEKLLKILERKIEKLEKKEHSLDDMDKEDSDYILADRYKKRFIQVWKKLCELTKNSENTGRCVEKKFRYKGSRHPAINKKITAYINKYKEVPDFTDVLELVTKVDDANSLHIDCREEATKVFKEVVEMLKARRVMDFEELLDVPEDNMDPADDDNELAVKLNESQKLGIERINQVIDNFAQKQIVTNDKEEEDNQSNNGSEEQNGVDKEDKNENNLVEETEDETLEESDEDEEEEEKVEANLDDIQQEFQEELDSQETETEDNKVDDTESSEDEESDSSDDDDEPIPTVKSSLALQNHDTDEPIPTVKSSLALQNHDTDDGSSNNSMSSFLQNLELNSQLNLKRSLSVSMDEVSDSKKVRFTPMNCADDDDDDDVIVLN